MLPGFLHRLLAEIRYLVEKPKYKKALGTKTFRIHTPPAKANCVAWLGGRTVSKYDYRFLNDIITEYGEQMMQCSVVATQQMELLNSEIISILGVIYLLLWALVL